MPDEARDTLIVSKEHNGLMWLNEDSGSLTPNIFAATRYTANDAAIRVRALGLIGVNVATDVLALAAKRYLKHREAPGLAEKEAE